MNLEPRQILVAAMAAMLSGFSKTGVPGSGILVVPMMAYVFGGHLSIGATLPILIAADCFAVSFYRRDAEWPRIWSLVPWVLGGLGLGVLFLLYLPHRKGTPDPLNPIIGGIVLTMVGIQLLRGKLGQRLVPTSPAGSAITGVLAGFTTMASNAAGPIMALYMMAAKLPKIRFMGTSAWYFFILNLVKVPLVLLVTVLKPGEPLITLETLMLDLWLLPAIVIGAILGRRLLHVIPEKAFNAFVVILAALAAVKLLLS